MNCFLDPSSSNFEGLFLDRQWSGHIGSALYFEPGYASFKARAEAICSGCEIAVPPNLSKLPCSKGCSSALPGEILLRRLKDCNMNFRLDPTQYTQNKRITFQTKSRLLLYIRLHNVHCPRFDFGLAIYVEFRNSIENLLNSEQCSLNHVMNVCQVTALTIHFLCFVTPFKNFQKVDGNPMLCTTLIPSQQLDNRSACDCKIGIQDGEKANRVPVLQTMRFSRSRLKFKVTVIEIWKIIEKV